MVDLRLFIWNDIESEGKEWKRVAAQDGFRHATLSTDTDAESVASAFTAKGYDLAILDVVHQGDPSKDRPALGLQIAAAVHRKDPLAPLIAVTREPEAVYHNYDTLEEYALAGIYHSSVVSPNTFKMVAVRQSLNAWHRSVSQCPLLRYCVRELRRVYAKEETAFAQSIIDQSHRLPFARTLDSWHEQLCDAVVEIPHARGFGATADAYGTIAKLLRQSDPFYMAAGLGRRHVSHNVQVFLIGLAILLGDSRLRRAAISDVKDSVRDGSDLAALADAICAWACASTTHDVGYLAANMRTVTKRLHDAAGRLVSALVACVTKKVRVPGESKWPTCGHATIGDKVWEVCGASTKGAADKRMQEIIRRAIARHDSSEAGVCRPVTESSWADFLIVLCDELQDWHRSRREDSGGKGEVAWRIFELERLHMECDPHDEVRLAMEYVTLDYPKFVREYLGTEGPDTVADRFASTLRVLCENLWYGQKWTIRLAASFPSRDIAAPVFRERILPVC